MSSPDERRLVRGELQSGLEHRLMSEQRKLEAELRDAQRLAIVGRLALGIAHDFRNVLTVIQGHAGLLQAEPNLSSAMRESLQEMLRATERAAKLTTQLLSFSHKTRATPRAIDLNQLLAEVSGLLHRSVGEDMEFEFKYEMRLPLIYVDPRLIEQCVLNIVLNAREAMPNGGQLLISTCIAEIDAAHAAHHPEARPGRFVCLSVADSCEATDERTATPFSDTICPAKKVTHRQAALSAVDDIIKQHQGWIEAQSETGHSAPVRIYLPIHAGPAQRPGSDTTSTRVTGRETLLVVEDEAPVRSIIRTMLEQRGFKVLEAASGIEALAIWHQHHDDISLLLTDVVMPAGLSGQELAEKFRSQKPSLKVLYTSGYSPRAAGNGLSPENGTQFLEKPFDAAKLAQAVRRRLDALD